VTLVNFGAGDGDTARVQRPVPGQGEQAARFAPAQAMRAFAAHPGGAGGFRNAASDEEDFEEAELPDRSPAVEALSLGVHRQVWSTSEVL